MGPGAARGSRQARNPAPKGRPGASGAPAARTLRWVLLLTAAAFLLRLANVLAGRANPFFQYLPVDSGAYDRWGQRIAGGEWIGRSIFYQDPLYPYFLGVFYKLIGRHLTALLLVQGLLGALNVPLLWSIASRLWNPRAGLVAALLAALYAPFVFYDGLVLKTFLEVLLLNGALLALIAAAQAGDRPSALRRGALAGLLLGLGTLARANYLILVPLMLLWLARWADGGYKEESASRSAPRSASPESTSREGSAAHVRNGSRLPLRYGAGLSLLAGMAIVLLPILVRNRVVGGEWVLTTAQGGQNFYIGNNPENRRGTYSAPSFVRPDPQHEEEDFRSEAQRRTGRNLSPTQASSYWMKQALAWMAADPGRALALDLKKLGLFLHRYEEPDNEDIQFWGRYSPWLRLNPFRFGVIAPLALVGLALGWPQRRRLSLLYLVLGGYALSVSLFFILARYRLPAVSLLLIFAAGAVTELITAVQLRERRRLYLAAAVLVPSLILVHRPNAEESGPMTPEMYTNLGMAYLQQNRLPEALEAQQQAVRMAPEWPDGRYNMAILLYKSGRIDEALEQFREVTRLKPDHAEAWSYIGNLLEEKGRLEDAAAALGKAHDLQPQSAPHLFNLARVLGELHRKDELETALQKLYAMNDPQYSIDARLIEARFRAETGDKEGAARILRAYLADRPDSPMRGQLEGFLRQWEGAGSSGAAR